MRITSVALAGALSVLGACGDNKASLHDDAGVDAPTLLCGNGVVDENESCDDGEANGGPDARCTTMCRWVCFDDTYCTDNDPCNGEETCSEHRCISGTGLADGTTCGDDQLCRNFACTDSVCGDGFVTAPAEECDDANSTPGDGCENDCTFSCVSTDAMRDCTPADPCAGQGTCDDTTHICTPGTQLPDNDPCGQSGYCDMGVCTQPTCGNGDVEPGETCDLGAANGTMGSGCKADCTYECVNAASDCPSAPACQMPSCNGAHACANVADPTLDGMTCGTDLICNDGACTSLTAVCGNGVTETGEECDFGSGNNTTGSGCEPNCQFSCDMVMGACTDGNACNGTESCTEVTVNSRAGQHCTSTAPLDTGASCGTNQICLSNLCVNSTCGDGYVDTPAGESCEPPNVGTCDADCHLIVCGDGIRAGTEQCDDGNMTNLDGCDSTCKFEQSHRVNTLSIAFDTDTFCTANRLGAAIVGDLAQGELNGALGDGVADGSITIELKAIDLDDLSGTSDPQLSLGVLTGAPVLPGWMTYDGTADLDWWYTTSPSVIDSQRQPLTTVPASITAKNLVSTPTDISVDVNLGGVPATLDMLSAKISANLGATSAPLMSMNTTQPPGHLASENLDPSLTSFASASNGKLCGNVTAQSLANVLAPDALVGCGGLLAPCTQCYTATHTLLDIIVHGCTQVLLGVQIAGTQPDTFRAGAGGVYTFTTDSTTRRVTACTQGNSSKPLAECLANATYTSFLQFATGRVIAK